MPPSSPVGAPSSAENARKAKGLLLDVVERCTRDRWALFPPLARELDAKPRGVVLFGMRSPTFFEHLNAVRAAVVANPSLELRAVVDDDPAQAGQAAPGCRVMSSAQFFAEAAQFADCLVVDRTCTWLPGVKYKTRFRQLGMPFLRLEQFLNAPSLKGVPGYYRGNSDFMLAHIDELLRLESIWADERSAEVYYTVLAGFIGMDFTYFALTCDDHRQRYFPPDVGFQYGAEEVLLDCGAHDGGETMIFAERTANRFKAAHAFEPDLRNYGVLSRNMARYMATHGLDNIYCYPIGVYDRNDYLAFSGESTIVTVSGERATDGRGLFVARLDDLVGEATYLRLEVEGAEIPALRGAARLIRAHRPKLAVSAYHLPDDFLTIHRSIAELDLGYQFRLRHQSLEAGVLCYYCC